jgi:hypothetical protein
MQLHLLYNNILLCKLHVSVPDSKIRYYYTHTHTHTNIYTGRHIKRELLKPPPKKLKKSNKKMHWQKLNHTTCLLRDSKETLNGEVVCSSRSLFRSAANCTWLPLHISKVPVFLCHPIYIYIIFHISIASWKLIVHVALFNASFFKFLIYSFPFSSSISFLRLLPPRLPPISCFRRQLLPKCHQSN